VNGMTKREIAVAGRGPSTPRPVAGATGLVAQDEKQQRLRVRSQQSQKLKEGSQPGALLRLFRVVERLLLRLEDRRKFHILHLHSSH
jgi:hypothetical protein